MFSAADLLETVFTVAGERGAEAAHVRRLCTAASYNGIWGDLQAFLGPQHY
jgi:hypothetical protein